MTTATPRPWNARAATPSAHVWDVGASGVLIAQVLSSANEADATLIVEAVNLHEELVGALKDALKLDGLGYEQAHAEHRDHAKTESRCAMDILAIKNRARDVLGKVKP